jgi:hypothetical protein
MPELVKESRDAFLDAFLKLSIFYFAWELLAVDEIVKFTIYDKVAWLWWFLRSFSALLGIAYILLAISAWRYFTQKSFDRRTLVVPKVYLWMVAIYLAFSVIQVIGAIADWYRVPGFPAWLDLLVLLLLNGLLAFLMFYPMSLRKKIPTKPSAAALASKSLWILVGVMTIAAIVFTATRSYSLPGGSKSAPEYIVSFVSIAIDIVAVWYGIRTIKQLRVLSKP